MQREHLVTGLPCSDALAWLSTLLGSRSALPGIDNSIAFALESWIASGACSLLLPSCLAHRIQGGMLLFHCPFHTSHPPKWPSSVSTSLKQPESAIIPWIDQGLSVRPIW